MSKEKQKKAEPDIAEVSVSVPLVGFLGPSPVLPLGTNISINQLTQSEKHQFRDKDHYLSTLYSRPQVQNCHYRISYRFDADLTDDKWLYVDSINLPTKVVMALRLLREGRCLAPFAIVKPHGSEYFVLTIEDNLFHHYSPRRYIYELNELEVDRLKSIFSRLCVAEAECKALLDLAMRRFLQCYSRRLLEDKLIDLTIALESTVLYGIRDELGYRLALRGAVLLSDSEDPEITFKYLKFLYRIRSEIIHDGKRLGRPEFRLSEDEQGPIPWDSYIADIERIVRSTLLKYIWVNDFKTFNQELDEAVLRQLK